MFLVHNKLSLLAGGLGFALIVSASAMAGPPADPVLDALVKGDQERACQLAVSGNVRTTDFFIAACYETGTGVPQDFARAAALFRKEMEDGHSGAQAHLGQLMVLGRVPGGRGEGMRLLRQAAEYGGPEAEMLFGRYLVEQPGDRDEAIRWLKRSAASFYPGGAYELAQVYTESGDAKAAETWRAKGRELEAQRGSFADAVAFANSGKTREAPRDVYNRAYRILSGQEPGTLEQAVEMVRYGARGHIKEAEAQLGLMYQRGVGMPQDREEAIYWFRRAALNGSPDGERLLREELSR